MTYLLRYCHCSRLLSPEKKHKLSILTKRCLWSLFRILSSFIWPTTQLNSQQDVEQGGVFKSFSKPIQSKHFSWKQIFLIGYTVLTAARWCWWHTTLGNVKRISTFSLSLSSKNIRFFFIRNRFKDTEPGCVVGLLRGVDNSESGRTFNFSLVSTL